MHFLQVSTFFATFNRGRRHFSAQKITTAHVKAWTHILWDSRDQTWSSVVRNQHVNDRIVQTSIQYSMLWCLAVSERYCSFLTCFSICFQFGRERQCRCREWVRWDRGKWKCRPRGRTICDTVYRQGVSGKWRHNRPCDGTPPDDTRYSCWNGL